MYGLLTSGSVLAAFLAGGVALFAPCCIVFLAPGYLALSGRMWSLPRFIHAPDAGRGDSGGFIIYLVGVGEMTGGLGFQVAIGRGLATAFRDLLAWTRPVPEPVLGLAVLALAAVFIVATLRDRGRPAGPEPEREPGTTPGQPGSPARQPGSARARAAAQRKRQAAHWARLRLADWLAAAGLIIATALSADSGSGTAQSSAVRSAPGFTLASASGQTVSLAGYRGRDVVLYFNEGTGCDVCFYQMTEFQNHAADLARAGITIVPIVMNPAGQVRPQLAAFGIRTPYLIDATGSVSRAYGMFGKGMHPGLPGHGFVLIDARGIQRWHGEYPSMYLSAAGLIAQVKAHL